MVSSGFIFPCSSSGGGSSCSCPTSCESTMALHCRLEELKDMYTAMLRQEATTYKVAIPQDDEDESWRPSMVSWMYNIVDIFGLVPQVVGTAIYYLDKAHSLVETPSDYQLLGLTALQLAIKVHETKLFPIQQLVRIGNSGFTVDDVVRMEQRLLVHLNYHLHPPTAECFVLAFYELLPKNPTILRLALDLIKRAICSAELLHIPYSVLAYGSLLAAMECESSRLTLEHKKTFGWNMMQLARLTADTPGLVDAYEWMAPSWPSSSPMPAKPSRQQQQELAPEEPEPQPVQEQEQPAQEKEVIFGTEDGIEVQWCGISDTETNKQGELRLSASFSPRQVAYS